MAPTLRKRQRLPVSIDYQDLMHATRVDRAFTRPDWVFEPKLDGLRVLAIKEGDDVRLLSKNGNDYAGRFPEIVVAMEALPDLALDGELVVLDEQGHPVFERVRTRMVCRRPLQIHSRASSDPATICAFDLLQVDGLDLRDGPLLERKQILKETLEGAELNPRIQYVEHFVEHGEALFALVDELGLEGIVGKLAESPYRGGKTRHWLKIKTEAGRRRERERRSM